MTTVVRGRGSDIFFVVVDLCEHGVTASKRGPLKSVDISDKELIQSVETDQKKDGEGTQPGSE